MVAGPRSALNPAGEDLLHRGLLALQRGDFSRAQEVFRLSYGLLADDPRPLFFWALTLDEQGKSEEAGAMYRKTVDAFRSKFRPGYILSLLFFAAGQTVEAHREAQKALAAFPERTRSCGLYNASWAADWGSAKKRNRAQACRGRHENSSGIMLSLDDRVRGRGSVHET